MGSNFLNFLPSLLAVVPPADSTVLVLFSAAAIVIGIFCIVFMLFEMGEVRRLRERNRRTHDEWQQAYTLLFRTMIERLNEANRSAASTPPPELHSPDDEYFARLSRPRRFLDTH